jgi:hypothetical protein
MTRQIYNLRESANRLLRLLRGETPEEPAGSLTGEVLSENQAASDIAELVAGSLPGYSFVLPASIVSAIGTAGFATGTATSLAIYTGSALALENPTILSFDSSFLVEVTGTIAYISVP